MWVRSLVGRTPWRRAWQPTLVSLPGKFHRQRNLAGYGRTWQKQLSIHTCRQKEAKMIIPLSIMLNTRCFSLNLEEKCGDKQSFRWVVCLVWCRLGHLERHLFIFVFFYGLHLDLRQLPLFKVFFFFPPKSPALEISAFCIFRCWGQGKYKMMTFSAFTSNSFWL